MTPGTFVKTQTNLIAIIAEVQDGNAFIITLDPLGQATSKSFAPLHTLTYANYKDIPPSLRPKQDD